MDERLNMKYKRLREIINDVASCADNKLVLVGGTALALFYLNHRVSIDLDFIPTANNDDVHLKRMLKGCLTKKGYKTIPAARINQFVVQFEDTSIKIEVFTPDYKIKKIKEFELEDVKIMVASINDLLELKLLAYADRKEARDIYDIIFILKHINESMELVKRLIRKHGSPVNGEGLEKLVIDDNDLRTYREVIRNAT